MTDTENQDLPPAPSVSFLGLLLRPRQTLLPAVAAEYVPFTAIWSVISAAGIIFYLMLPIYPRVGFEFADFLATLALLSPFVGLIALRLAAWILSKSGRFFGGKANTRLCHGALSVGLLPVGVSLLISLPIFVMFPNDQLAQMLPAIGMAHLVATVWAITNLIKAVSTVHQIKALHAVVALLGMVGFMFATFNIVSMVL